MKKYFKIRGFTLIELMVVISIIGVLASVVLLGMRTARGKAQDVQVKADIRGIANALEAYAIEHGDQYPSSNGEGLDAGSYNVSRLHLFKSAIAAGSVDCNADPNFNVACKLIKQGYIDKMPRNRATSSFYYYMSLDGGSGYSLQGKMPSDPTKVLEAKSNGGGYSITSIKYSMSILASLIDTAAPVFPLQNDLSVVKDGTSAVINWSAALDSGAVLYKMAYSKDGAAQTPISGIQTNSYILNNIASAHYSFTISAYDGSGNTQLGPSKEIDFTSNIIPSLTGYINVSAVSEDEIIMNSSGIVFRDNGLPDGNIFMFEYREVGGSWTDTEPKISNAPNIILNLLGGKNYDFRMRAINTAGNASGYVTLNPATYPNGVAIPTNANGKTDFERPQFSGPASVESLPGHQYAVSWSRAVDNVGIDSYKVSYWEIDSRDPNSGFVSKSITLPSSSLSTTITVDANPLRPGDDPNNLGYMDLAVVDVTAYDNANPAIRNEYSINAWTDPRYN